MRYRHQPSPAGPGALCDRRKTAGAEGQRCPKCYRITLRAEADAARALVDPPRYRFPGGEVLFADLPAESPEDEGDGLVHPWAWGARLVARRPRSARDGRFLEAQAAVDALAGVDRSKPKAWGTVKHSHWLAPGGPVPTPSEEEP